MQRQDHPKVANYKDIFSKTYYVSNESPDQTAKFSKFVNDTFKDNSGGTYVGVIGGVDPFMNYALNSNSANFVGIDVNPTAVELMAARLELALKCSNGKEYLENLFGCNLEDIYSLINTSTDGEYVDKDVLASYQDNVLGNYANKNIELSENLKSVLDLYYKGYLRFVKHMRNTYLASLNHIYGWLNLNNYEIVRETILPKLTYGQASLTDIFDYSPVVNSDYVKLVYISNVHHYLDKPTRQEFAANLIALEAKQKQSIFILADGAEELLTTQSINEWLINQEYRDFSGNVINLESGS